MAAMMQRRLGAKLRTADDYATADEKEIKELSAMTGIKYKQPARRPQPKRIAAPASTLVNLNELKQLAEEDGSPVKARKALAPPETAELGDVWWNTHREETEEPAPVARSPPRPDRKEAVAKKLEMIEKLRKSGETITDQESAASSTSRRKQKAASAAFVASASTAAVASNRQATAGRKKTAPRRKTPDARRAPRGGILDDGAGPAIPRRKTPDAAARGGIWDVDAGPAAIPRRKTPDAAVPRPGDPYKAASTAPRRKTPEPAAAPRVVRTARFEAVVPPPRSKPRKSPAALPSLTCAPDTSFDLFAWPGEAPARDEDALGGRLVAL